jgi:general stress protein YciG
MPGTLEGGLKAKEKNLARDPEFYRKLGAKGGVASNTGGFAHDDRTFLQKLFRRPKRAKLAGRKGGAISKRRRVAARHGR